MNKYRLRESESAYVARDGKVPFSSVMYRIEALVDIPRYGVKAGDLGGLVSSSSILSHQGDCWIGENAKVYGQIKVSGNALVTGEAKIAALHTMGKVMLEISGHAIIRGNAMIVQKTILDLSKPPSVIGDTAEIYGNAEILSPNVIAGNSRIYGYARLAEHCSVLGNAWIGGNANVQSFCLIEGNSRVFQDANISKGAELGGDTIIAGETQIAENARVFNRIFPKYPDSPIREVFAEDPDAPYANKPDRSTYPLNYSGPIRQVEGTVLNTDTYAPAVSSKSGIYAELMAEIKGKVEEYHNDVINLIRYPVMSDMTNDFTRSMVTAMRQAERAEKAGDASEFKDAVLAFEEKFLSAESNARRIASTLFTDDEKKRTETAKQMFALAVNEGSPESEKKIALRRGFKELEGILDVPETAVNAIVAKAGLLELEA